VTYDPVADVERRYPDFTIDRWPIRPAKAALLPKRRRIITDDELDEHGHRCGVGHEVVHLDRGDQCTNTMTVLDAKREHAVDRETALRMIPWERLRVVLQVDQDEHLHAQELDVDVETLRTRVEHTLTDQQRAELEQLLGGHPPQDAGDAA
jgi:hypothetical protein